MKRVITTFWIAALVMLTGVLHAQQTYRLNPEKSRIIIEGTSNVHDWEMMAKRMSANTTIALEGTEIKDIKDIHFSLRATNIESDNSIMTKKTQEALEADKHPEITFKLNSVNSLSSSDNSFKGIARGVLSIAGEQKNIAIPFTGKFRGENQFVVTGKEIIDMTEFDIKPPKAMLGALKTGEKVTVNYEFSFVQEQFGEKYNNN